MSKLITREEFINQLNRLVEVYGKEKYPKQRLALMWAWAKTLPKPIVIGVIDEAIANCATAPMLDKLKKFAEPALANLRSWDSRRDKALDIGCIHCRGDGMLLAIRRDNPNSSPVAFRCNHCSNAFTIGLSEGITMWSDEKKALFEPMIAAELPLDARDRIAEQPPEQQKQA